jgi:hypothetical protein
VRALRLASTSFWSGRRFRINFPLVELEFRIASSTQVEALAVANEVPCEHDGAKAMTAAPPRARIERFIGFSYLLLRSLEATAPDAASRCVWCGLKEDHALHDEYCASVRQRAGQLPCFCPIIPQPFCCIFCACMRAAD